MLRHIASGSRTEEAEENHVLKVEMGEEGDKSERERRGEVY